MEDVLNLYAQPYDPQRPVVCLGEARKELHGQTRPPLPPLPGQPARQDYEYSRAGTANLFLSVEPLAGRRRVSVTEHRAGADFAHQMKHLCDVEYPDAEVIRVVLDNLNTHGPGSLFAAFDPEEAWRLVRRLEFHYTPKHASWLNMAELEPSVLARQCLDRRIGEVPTLVAEVAAWEQPRNAARVKIKWCSRAADARVKLKHLYPQVQQEQHETSVSDH